MSASDTRALNRVDDFLNYDFCPWANRWVYWMKHPLVGVAVVAITAGICGTFVAPQAWFLCAGLLIVGMIGLIWPAVSIAAVRANVRFQQAWCEEEAEVSVEVSLTNHLPLPIFGLSLRTSETHEVLVSFARVPAWRKTVYQWRLTPHQRGSFPREELLVQTGFPFGVWTAQRTASVSGELLVLPKAVDLDAVPALVSSNWGNDQYSSRRTGDCGDIMGTRPFRPGDSLRQIHWATTARTGTLVCTERQLAIQNRVVCYLDVATAHHAGAGVNSSLEWSIRVFAGICRELASQGSEVRAVFGQESLQVQSGVAGQRRLLMRLARLPEAGIEQPTRQPNDASIAVVTDLSPAGNATLPVVLEAKGFESLEEAPASEDRVTSTGAQGAVTIRNCDDLRFNLNAKWRRACHAVS